MKPRTDPDFLATARGLALEAGRRVVDLLRAPLVTARKADHSLVTNADQAANAILCAGLRRRFPDHRILSEETGWEGPSGSEWVWLIDPLDGTRAYAKGLAGFSVMAGLLREGTPHLGVVYDPLGDVLVEAVRGEGAFEWSARGRTPLRVSDRGEWSRMPVITSGGFPAPLRKELESKWGLSFLDPVHSVGIKVSLLVRRGADLYLNHHGVHVWDTCAPLVILEEAGGRMTHWDGSALAYDLRGRTLAHPQGTLATNGVRHGDLIDLLSPLLRL